MYSDNIFFVKVSYWSVESHISSTDLHISSLSWSMVQSCSTTLDVALKWKEDYYGDGRIATSISLITCSGSNIHLSVKVGERKIYCLGYFVYCFKRNIVNLPEVSRFIIMMVKIGLVSLSTVLSSLIELNLFGKILNKMLK